MSPPGSSSPLPVASPRTPLAPDNSVEDAQVECARLKRTIADLKEAITPTPNKRPPSLITAGRCIRRVIALFQDLPTIVQEADRREESVDDTDEEDTPDAASIKRSRDRTFTAYSELIRFIPNFKVSLLRDETTISSYFNLLTRGANDARSDDIGTIKRAIATYLNKSPDTRPPLQADDRSMRGLQHDTTGLLLCPIEYDWDDEEVRAKLRSSAEGFDFSNSFYVRCLYRNNTGDPDNVESDFLRGSALVMAYLSIFTSPTAASRIPNETSSSDIENSPVLSLKSRPSKATKSSVSKKLNLTSVTPRTIAYAAVMLHFSLTDAPHWQASYNGFSYELFYNFIIDFFEDVSGPSAQRRVKELLAWWDRQIYPSRSTAIANSRASLDKLQAQRARREVEDLERARRKAEDLQRARREAQAQHEPVHSSST